MARKRRFSDDAFGPTIERLMAEAGLTYRSLAEKTRLSAGYLNHLVHGNRPVPSDDVIKTLARALGVEAVREVLASDRGRADDLETAESGARV